MLGAEGFVNDPALLRNAAAVVNVEARGTSGPSFLFETSRHNAWLARVIAKRVAAAGHELVLLRHLRAAAERHRPHGFQTRRTVGRRLRLHRTSGPLPHAARQLRECDAVDGAASRRSHAGDGARAGRHRSSPDQHGERGLVRRAVALRHLVAAAVFARRRHRRVRVAARRGVLREDAAAVDHDRRGGILSLAHRRVRRRRSPSTGWRDCAQKAQCGSRIPVR